MIVVCFEDAFVDRLRPTVWTRPAYAVTCGGYRLIDWIGQIEAETFGHVRPHLRQLQPLDYGLENFTDLSTRLRKTGDRNPTSDRNPDTDILLINARLTPSVNNWNLIQRFLTDASLPPVIDHEDDVLLIGRIDIAARGGGGGEVDATYEAADSGSVDTDSALLTSLLDQAMFSRRSDVTADVLRFPHHFIDHHLNHLGSSLSHRIGGGGASATVTGSNELREIRDGVFVGPDVKLAEYVVTNTTDGPIVLEQNVRVGPFSYLAGPLWIGAGSRVIEHAAIKDAVAVGHTAKVGGEIEASVIEPYSNKQHHGFLGHSYLGSWINLGAGTSNSDLKNTYGTINMRVDLPSKTLVAGQEIRQTTDTDNPIATGMQFMGCVIGDYTKTAINTSIFTGKTIGVCSMLYGFITENVPSFTNAGDVFDEVTSLPADVMLKTQQRMFGRRNVPQRECDRQLITDLYQLTAAERLG